MTLVRAYWWRERPNFGDALAPLLLERFAGIRAKWAAPEQARVISIGSIFGHLPRGWDGCICGAGKLGEGDRLYLSRKVKITKAAALAAAAKLVRERRAAGEELFGVVSPETKNAINEARGRAAGFRVSPAAGAWQLLQGEEPVGSMFPSPATCWKLAASILDRQQRGEADPQMALAASA